MPRPSPSRPRGRLRAGETDLALVYDYASLPWPRRARADSTPLVDDRYDVILPTGHRLAARRRLALADLADESWIASTPAMRLPRDHRACLPRGGGFEPRVAFEADETLAAQALVAAGVGVTLLPRRACDRPPGGRGAHALRRPERRVWAAAAGSAYRSPASEAMLQILSDVAEEFRETRLEEAASSRRPLCGHAGAITDPAAPSGPSSRPRSRAAATMCGRASTVGRASRALGVTRRVVQQDDRAGLEIARDQPGDPLPPDRLPVKAPSRPVDRLQAEPEARGVPGLAGAPVRRAKQRGRTPVAASVASRPRSRSSRACGWGSSCSTCRKPCRPISCPADAMVAAQCRGGLAAARRPRRTSPGAPAVARASSTAGVASGSGPSSKVSATPDRGSRSRPGKRRQRSRRVGELAEARHT